MKVGNFVFAKTDVNFLGLSKWGVVFQLVVGVLVVAGAMARQFLPVVWDLDLVAREELDELSLIMLFHYSIYLPYLTESTQMERAGLLAYTLSRVERESTRMP